MKLRFLQPNSLERLMIALVLSTLVAIQSAFSLELKWGAGGESVSVVSVQKRKITYVGLADVERNLPVTLRQDREAGLIVLCTEERCLPIFQLDPEEYLQRDSADFIGINQLADALGCKADIAKGKASLECAVDPAHFRKVGSAVGDAAPGIRSTSPESKSVTLSDLRRDHKVILVFVRSLDWDPFSQLLLLRLQNVQDSLRAANVRVLIIHGYGEKQNTMWQDSLKLPFPLVTDDASAAMRGYDVFDRGPLPHPALFVVDQSGIIRLRKVFADLSIAPDISDVMQMVAGMP